MSWIQAMFAGMVPAFVVAGAIFAAEWLQGSRGTDWWRNLQAWFLCRLAAITALPLFPLWASEKWSLIDGSALPFWIAFPILVVARDLGEYLFHRAQHSVPFLWAMHSLHHSDPDMMVLTTQRHFWGDQFLKELTIWPAALLVISPTPALLFAWSLLTMWNFALHSSIPLDFGRFSWVLNSPEYHRRHHSIDPAHYNSNFAALLPIWDVVFGGYHRAEGHPRTGMPRKPESLWELAVWPLIWDRAPTGEAKPAAA
ncbi:MAG: sterol desaturase family protein [Sphingomonadales bacterium]|nr:sterol desaturase family protein [Sphingomonadales bacterium]